MHLNFRNSFRSSRISATVIVLATLLGVLFVGHLPGLSLGLNTFADSGLVQNTSGQTVCSSLTGNCVISFASDVTSGDVVVALVYNEPNTLTNAKDTRGSSYTLEVSGPGSTFADYIFVGQLTSSGPDSFSFNVGEGCHCSFYVELMEVSGVTTLFAQTQGGVAIIPETKFIPGAFLVALFDDSESLTGANPTNGFTGIDAITPDLGFEYVTSGISSPTSFSPCGSECVNAIPGFTELGLALQPLSTTETTTVTSISTVTQTIQPTLSIEARDASGNPLVGQSIMVTGTGVPSSPVSTGVDGNYNYPAGVLTEGDSYTASTAINGVTLSGTVTLGGNSVILLEPTAPSFPTPEFPAGILALIIPLLALATFFAIMLRSKSNNQVRKNLV